MFVLCAHGHSVGSAAVEQQERGLKQQWLAVLSFGLQIFLTQQYQGEIAEAFQSYMETQCKEVADRSNFSS